MPRSYWDWQEMLNANRNGFFPYTPATNLLYGLQEKRFSGCCTRKDCPMFSAGTTVTRKQTRAAWFEHGDWNWFCEEPSSKYSSSCTGRVFMPERPRCGPPTRAIILENFDMSLGAGLSKIAGKVFRIGHLGSFNDLMLAGTLSMESEMGLRLAEVPHRSGGVRYKALDSADSNRQKIDQKSFGKSKASGAAFCTVQRMLILWISRNRWRCENADRWANSPLVPVDDRHVRINPESPDARTDEY